MPSTVPRMKPLSSRHWVSIFDLHPLALPSRGGREGKACLGKCEHPLPPGRVSKDIFSPLLSSGSVVVEHDVILSTAFTPGYKETFKKVIKEVEEKIMNVPTTLHDGTFPLLTNGVFSPTYGI